MGVDHVPLLESLAAKALSTISSGDAQALSNTAWAFAAFELSNQPLLESISAAARPRIRDFHAPNLSNTAWAWAGLLYWHGPLMHSISASSLATLRPQSNSLSPACEDQDG